MLFVCLKDFSVLLDDVASSQACTLKSSFAFPCLSDNPPTFLACDRLKDMKRVIDWNQINMSTPTLGFDELQVRDLNEIGQIKLLKTENKAKNNRRAYFKLKKTNI